MNSATCSTKPFYNGYQLVTSIGSGGFSHIYEVLKMENDKKFAVKETYLKNQNDEQAILNEMDILKNLNHRNIVKCFDTFYYGNDYFYGVMELCDMDLSKFIKETIHDSFKNSKKYIQIVKDVFNGLNHIHGKGIVHRDLKPENILLSSTGIAKLSDFNLAATTSMGLSEVCGTKMYMPPEMYENKKYGFAVDLWSIGIVIYQLFEKKHPLQVCLKNKIIDKELLKEVTISCEFTLTFGLKCIKETLYDKIKMITYDCLSYDPTDRKTAMEHLEVLESY